MREVKVPESVTITGQLAGGAHDSWIFSGLAAFAPGDSVEPGEKAAAQPVELPADLRGEWAVEADFVRAIREGGPVYPSFDDGVAYMEFVEAVARSIAEERVIHLPAS